MKLGGGGLCLHSALRPDGVMPYSILGKIYLSFSYKGLSMDNRKFQLFKHLPFFFWLSNRMDEWVDGCICGWMGVWVGEWMDGWVNGWMGGWVGGWVDGWLDGWVGG